MCDNIFITIIFWLEFVDVPLFDQNFLNKSFKLFFLLWNSYSYSNSDSINSDSSYSDGSNSDSSYSDSSNSDSNNSN